MARAKSKTQGKTKLKTNRGAAKRLKITGTGKIMRHKGWKGHLLTGKDSARKRRLTGAVELTKNNVKNVQRLVPNGLK